MASKVDYDYHQAQFTQLAEQEPGLTIKQYCERAGLNHGTAKRYLKSPKKTPSKAKVEAVREKKATRKKAAPRDWSAFYEVYLNACLENPALSITSFAETQGLPPPQCRRQFAAIRKTCDFADLEDQVDRAVSQFNDDLTRKKARAKSLKKKTVKVPVSEGATSKESAVVATNVKDHPSGSSDQVAEQSQKSQPYTGRDKYGRFTPGNSHSVIHGGYAQIARLDSDLVEVASNIDPTSLANELITARSQYLSMLRFVGEQRQALIEQYARGEPLKDFDDNDIPLTKALGDLEFGTAGKIRALEGVIAMLVGSHAKIVKDFTQLRHKEHELPAVSAVSALAITQKLFDEREAKEWTALETARQFERRGVPVPKSIMFEAEREIATYEAPIDDSGLSDDELDVITAQYMEDQRRYLENVLPEKREVLQEIFDKAARAEEGLPDVPPAEAPQDATSDDKSHQPPDDIDDDEDAVVGEFDDLSDFAPIDEGAEWQES